MVVPQTQRPALSGTALKRLALCSMLLDHLGASCLEAGVFSRPGPIYEPLLTLDVCLRWAGRLAFPLYCFLLVEGFLHTHSLRQYAGRMLAFALVSELPFDLAFFHTLVYRGHQNVYWTLFFGLCALGCLRHCGERSAPGIFSALALAVLAELLRTDYGAIGVLLIVVLYITRASRPLQCLFGAVAVCYELLCITPGDWPEPPNGVMTPALMDGQNFVVQWDATDAEMRQFLKKYGLSTERRCHVIDDQSNIAMVEAGLGISIMPRLLLSQCTANIKIYPIDPEEDRVVGLAVQRPTAMAPAVEQMFHHIVDYCKQMEH